MANTIKVFLVYAEEDYRFKDLVLGQVKTLKTPVEFVDMPAKQPWVPRWKAACRTRAFECDKAVVLISKKTTQGVGVQWELECIKESQMPVLGVYMEKLDRGSVPKELRDAKMIDWNWAEVSNFIQS